MQTQILRAPFGRLLSRGAAVAACLAFIGSPAAPLLACGHHLGPKPLFTAVYVFGDSWSDTGRTAAVTDPAPPPVTPYVNGKQCNGPVWVEYLAPALGLRYDPLDNFAWSGARTDRTNSEDPTGALGLFGMLDELDEFLELLGPAQQADPDALYVVLGGSKELAKIVQGSPADVVINSVVTNLVTIVGALRARGAQHIIVVDIPDWSYGPSFIARDAAQPGFLATIHALCVTVNARLNDALAAADLEVIQVSAFDLVTDAVANPCRYGLTNVTEPSFPDMSLARHYLWWDKIHMTSRMNAWLAVRMLEALNEADLLRHHRMGHGGHR